MSKMKRLWLAAVLTLCAGATASAYDLTGQSGHGGLTFKVNGTTASTADEGQAVTVKVKPDAGWQTKTVTARAYDTWGAAKARGSSRSIDILTVTPTGSGNTWTFTMPGASVEVSAEYRKLLTHADITVGSIAAVTYNGKAHKPAVTVKDGSTLLTLGTDYTVSYSSNTNAGTANVTITGQGNYGGSVVKRFTIRTLTVTDNNISVEYGGSVTELTVRDMGTQQGSTVKENLAVTALNYYRTLNGSDADAYTVCLPYAPPTDGNLRYYTLAGVDADGSTLQFDEIEGEPQAYTPYLVFAAATADIGREGFQENFVMVKEVSTQSPAGGYTLKGTLSGIGHADAAGLYILQAGNRWARVGSDTHAYLPPFRAYIEATDNARPALDSSFSGQPTGIGGMHTTDRDGTERWFDLSGHRVTAPVKAGIYLRNGRKEVVR